MKYLALLSILLFDCLVAHAQVPSRDSVVIVDSLRGHIYAMLFDGTDLYIGGSFNSVHGVAARNIARFDGTAWHPLTDSIHDGVSGEVRALIFDSNHSLVAGGMFDSAGDRPATNIARYSAAGWESLGQGLSDTVFVLKLLGNTILGGGAFTRSGDSNVQHLAALVAGDRWTPYKGYSFDRTVRALAGDITRLLVGGDFDTVNGSAHAYLAAIPDQNAILANGPVHAIVTNRGNIVTGGLTPFYNYRINDGYQYAGLLGAFSHNFNNMITGLVSLNEKTFFAYGAFDSVDGVWVPGIIFYNGLGLRRIDSSLGQTTAACIYGRDLYYATDRPDGETTISHFHFSDSISASYTYNDITYGAGAPYATMVLRNSPQSNAALQYRERAVEINGGAQLQFPDRGGLLPPGDSVVLRWDLITLPFGRSVGIISTELDNSENLLSIYTDIDYSGSNPMLVMDETDDLALSAVASNGDLRLSSSQPCLVELFTVLGGAIVRTQVQPGTTSSLPLASLPSGPLFLRWKESNGTVGMKRIILK